MAFNHQVIRVINILLITRPKRLDFYALLMFMSGRTCGVLATCTFALINVTGTSVPHPALDTVGVVGNTRGPFTEHVGIAGPVALEAGWTILLVLQTGVVHIAVWACQEITLPDMSGAWKMYF